MPLRLKQPPPPTKPFSFDASLSPRDDNIASPPSPPTSWLNAKDMKIFGSNPLRQEIPIVKCPDCSKPILQSAITEHADNCKKIRLGGAKKSAKATDAESAKKGKKRKAGEEEENMDGAPKKKVKVIAKRVKGPVDLDRHCGVINDKGLPCSRSLKCKTHSMGAKRSVEGRSKKYDELLLDWQRANDPNFVEPVKRETKAEKKAAKEREKEEKRRAAIEAGILVPGKKGPGAGKKGKKAQAALAAQAAAQAEDGDIAEDLDALDSEAEVESLARAVKAATARGVIGIPLAMPADAGGWFIQRRERLRVCRDLLVGALNPAAVVPPMSGFSLALGLSANPPSATSGL